MAQNVSANEDIISTQIATSHESRGLEQDSTTWDLPVDTEGQEQNVQSKSQHKRNRYRQWYHNIILRFSAIHSRIPYLRRVPFNSILIIILLVLINVLVWMIVLLVLLTHDPPYAGILSTAALAYSLGLRHALDADHISAIDLMTRRLIATGQRPVTVGTFFSLGHSTIVIITSVVVAATAAGVSERFGSFSNVGGIIGTSVSAAFLIVLGIMNGYILFRLVVQLRKVIELSPEQEASEAWKVEGGGVLFRILKRMFKLIDRPWKMYPLGVLFGLGFDTSSEIALLGIASIQGAKGTSIWLILIFPILFTVGMCLIDTIDGALMAGLYLAPMQAGDSKNNDQKDLRVGEVEVEVQSPVHTRESENRNRQSSLSEPQQQQQQKSQNLRVKSPLTFLYYSIVLTALTVMVALVIGIIQLLSLILNVAVSEDEANSNPFWHGVEMAGEYYDIIGAAICGSFIVVGLVSVLCYKPWRRWVECERQRLHGFTNHQHRSIAILDEADLDDSSARTPASRPGEQSGDIGSTAGCDASRMRQSAKRSIDSEVRQGNLLHGTTIELSK